MPNALMIVDVQQVMSSSSRGIGRMAASSAGRTATGELVVEKRNSSAFHATDLDRQLRDRNIDQLVIAGMQTEMCVDSACRAAAALDYRVSLVSDGHTTWDTPGLTADRTIAHHNRLLGSGFVDLAEAEQVQFQFTSGPCRDGGTAARPAPTRAQGLPSAGNRR